MRGELLRIVSEKQKKSREKFKIGGTKVHMRERAGLGLPSTSWWLDEKQFYSEAKQEEGRMRNSFLGRNVIAKTID